MKLVREARCRAKRVIIFTTHMPAHDCKHASSRGMPLSHLVPSNILTEHTCRGPGFAL